MLIPFLGIFKKVNVLRIHISELKIQTFKKEKKSNFPGPSLEVSAYYQVDGIVQVNLSTFLWIGLASKKLILLSTRSMDV